MDSFRCIQASRLLLDHQLGGIDSAVTGELAPAIRKIVLDASLLAFDEIVEQALTHDVHCVLISGDCFDPDDRSLRGPAALVRGMGRLAEHDIAVILHADRPDLWSSWPAGLKLPPNVHRLGPGWASSVSIAREGRLVATIAATDIGQQRSDSVQPAHRGWHIHLPAAHAPGASATSGTIDLPDDCGPAQGMGPDEIGPHGFTLVECTAAGEPRCTFVPAAPVRWERFAVEILPAMSRDDLVQEMASRLEQTDRHACEKVWLIAWNITGTGPLFEQLDEPGFRHDLLEELAALDAVPGVQIHTHTLRLDFAAPVSRPMAQVDAGHGAAQNHPDLAAEFTTRLGERCSQPRQELAGCLAGSAFAGGPWEVAMESLLAELDAGEITHEARRLTMHWFAGREELSS